LPAREREQRERLVTGAPRAREGGDVFEPVRETLGGDYVLPITAARVGWDVQVEQTEDGMPSVGWGTLIPADGIPSSVCST